MTVAVSGLWRCLSPKGCERAVTRTPFEGPTQADAQKETDPLRCPDCGSQVIMYAGDRESVREDDVEEEHDAA